jgi:hypothetical protein
MVEWGFTPKNTSKSRVKWGRTHKIDVQEGPNTQNSLKTPKKLSPVFPKIPQNFQTPRRRAQKTMSKDLSELIKVISEQPLEDWRFGTETDEEKPTGCILNYAGAILGYGKGIANFLPLSAEEAYRYNPMYLAFLSDFGLNFEQASYLCRLNDKISPAGLDQEEKNDIALRVKQQVVAYLEGILHERHTRTYRYN